jgi:hypothetical protein
MPQLSKKALACKRARAKRHSWAPTGVRGFEEKHPDPPAVRKRSYVVVERRLASAICVDSETQTSCPLLRDAATQTEFLASPQQTFIQQTLSATQQRVVELEEALETSRNTLWSASDTLCLPFLLPYSLMALLVLNLRNALHALFSHNTDFRKMFLHYLCQGFNLAQLAPILGFTVKTLKRAMQQKPGNVLIGDAISQKTRKSRIHPSVFADARKILDTLAPIRSGKVYRVVSCTLNYLYEQYFALASHLNPRHPPLSYPTFIGKILDIKNNYVHFENNPDFCPLCREKDELELISQINRTASQNSKLALLQEHDRIAHCHWKVYHEIMEDLIRNRTHRIIVQDFNQQHASMNLQTQVLTLVAYGAPSGYLERHYFNYFLPKEQANNLTAVIACHRDFFGNPQHTFISSATHIHVFNDGGPKHFKLTGYLAHMAKIAEILDKKKVTIVQHYFASYHGSGPADAVASHLKRKLRNIRANFRHNAASVEEMAQLCAQIENSDLSLAIQIPPELLLEEAAVHVETCAGIKKYHKVTFASNQVVCLWSDSASQVPSLIKPLAAQGILA